MPEKKTYYWIKLQKSFFNSLEIRTILKHEKGAEYVVFWQRLLLEIIDKIDNGLIRYKEKIPYTPEVMSTMTDTDIDTVKGAMTLFIKSGMIEYTDDGDLIIDELIQELVGRITDEGMRKKIYRAKIKDLKLLGQCPDVSQNVPTVLEKEIQKELETEKEKKKDSSLSLITDILNCWTDNGLAKHSLTTIQNNIKPKELKIIESYPVNVLKQAIENYATVCQGEGYFWTWDGWTLLQFISRGLINFLDEADPLTRFKTADSEAEEDKKYDDNLKKIVERVEKEEAAKKHGI